MSTEDGADSNAPYVRVWCFDEGIRAVSERVVCVVAFYIKPCVHLRGMFGDVWQSEEADPHKEPRLRVGISSWRAEVVTGGRPREPLNKTQTSQEPL